MKNVYSVAVGDWSQDGHNQYHTYDYEVNKTLEEIQQAYHDSVSLTGVDFGTLCSEYEEDFLEKEVIETLEKHGIKMSDYVNGEGGFPGTAIFADLFMRFILLSLPEFKYERLNTNRTYINGFWGKLNISLGYGLFS